MEIGESERRPSSGEMNEWVDEREACPDGWEGAHISGIGVMKEHARFAPREPLCEQDKLLTEERVKRMGYEEKESAIR